MARAGRRRTRGVRLGSIGGVPIILTAGWALITVAMTLVFTPVVRARLDLGIGAGAAVALAVPALLALSVLVHEVAHGVTAQLRGYRVREYVITLWGGHTTFMSEIDRPGAAAAVAVAGPVTNLLLAGAGWVIAPQLGAIGAFLAITLALTNAFVGVFNLLPASPLDGGKLLESLIWVITGDRWLGMRVAGRLGQGTAVVVVLGFVALPYLTQTRNTFGVITGLIVGLVIWQGATQTVKAASVRAAAEGFTLAPFLTPATLVDVTTTVAQVPSFPAVVTALRETTGTGDDEVDYAGLPGTTHRVVGVVDPAAVAAVPEDIRAQTQLAAVYSALPACVLTEREGSRAVTHIAMGLSARAKLFVLLDPGADHPAGPGTPVNIVDTGAVVAALQGR